MKNDAGAGPPRPDVGRVERAPAAPRRRVTEIGKAADAARVCGVLAHRKVYYVMRAHVQKQWRHQRC